MGYIYFIKKKYFFDMNISSSSSNNNSNNMNMNGKRQGHGHGGNNNHSQQHGKINNWQGKSSMINMSSRQPPMLLPQLPPAQNIQQQMPAQVQLPLAGGGAGAPTKQDLLRIVESAG